MKYLFSLKSSFYFLKNLVFALFCFLIGFLVGSGIIKVKAVEYYDVNKAYDAFKNTNFKCSSSENYNLFIERLERLIHNLDDLNIKYVLSISNFNTSTDSKSLTITFIDVSSFERVEVALDRLYLGSDLYSNSNKVYVNQYYASMSCDGSRYIDGLNEYLENNQKLYTSSDKPNMWNITTNVSAGPFISNSSSSNRIIYHSTIPIKIRSIYGDTLYSGFQLNGNIYKVGDSMPPTYRSSVGYGKMYYTFQENIYVDKRKQIRFHFDVPNNQAFSFFLNHSVTYQANHIPTAPYLEYVLDGVSYKLPLDKYYSLENEIIYADTQINGLPPGVTKLDFVVDLNANNWYDDPFKIFFESEYPFTYEYVEDDEEHYTIVDWTNNYGIMLIPKVYDMSTSISKEVYSNVFYRGNLLDMRVFASTDTSVPPLHSFGGLSNTEFWMSYQYLFRSNNKNQLLFFINSNYLTSSDNALLKYDTRYFVHTICKTENSCETVKNPNTGEDITVKPPDVSSDDEDYNSIDKIYKLLDDFIEKIKEGRIYVNQCFNAFWKEVPSEIQMLFIVLYVLLNIVALLKLGGWSRD